MYKWKIFQKSYNKSLCIYIFKGIYFATVLCNCESEAVYPFKIFKITFYSLQVMTSIVMNRCCNEKDTTGVKPKLGSQYGYQI